MPGHICNVFFSPRSMPDNVFSENFSTIIAEKRVKETDFSCPGGRVRQGVRVAAHENRKFSVLESQLCLRRRAGRDRVRDRGHVFHPAAAVGADLHVEVEGASKQGRPEKPVRASPARLAELFLFRLSGDHGGSPAGVRRDDAVISDEVHSGRRYESTELLAKL